MVIASDEKLCCNSGVKQPHKAERTEVLEAPGAPLTSQSEEAL